MIPVPSDKKELLKLANELIEQCRVSVGVRAAYYRMMNDIAETGRYDGTKSLINLMENHLKRTAAHLFSPVELKYALDFDNTYPKNIYEQGAAVAQHLTRQWERSSTDMTFGQGVYEALKYGNCILKQWVKLEGVDETPSYQKKLVMPWQFGVYREDENDIEQQTALCETITLTMPEVWSRIWHMPQADKLYERIKTHSRAGQSSSDPQSFFHQVLSSSTLNTSGVGSGQPQPGGVVQLGNSPTYAMMGPQIAAETVVMHELWVQDETDYTTIQLIEPDIIIAPRFKKENLLVKGSRLQPYRMICPNTVTNWFWGRSELVDMIEPQTLLSTWCDDLRRLVGVQIDKILAFVGENGVTDEIYGQFRQSGYMNMGQGSSVQDLTPKIPPELLPMLKFVIEIINTIGGFPEIMQGKGEAGVRAGSHANTLLKTASPSLRDRSLLVERQCAIAADLTLSLMEAKESRFYWTKADEPLQDVDKTQFLLSDLPDDWRVTVDSHSTSPIFADENTQLIMAGVKMGYLDGSYAIDNLSYPNKAAAKLALREKEKRQAETMAKLAQSDPEAYAKVLAKGGKR